MFDSICLNEPNIHLSHACNIILKYHSGINLLVHITLFGLHALQGSQPDCFC